MPPKSKSFVCFFSHIYHFALVSMCSPLFSPWIGCILSFPPQSGDSSQWSHYLLGSDQHLILGLCSCSFLNNYMAVTSGKILWGISYPCAYVSWVIWDYQVSSKLLLGTLHFSFDVMVPIREGARVRDWERPPHISVGTVSESKWYTIVYTSRTYQVWCVCKVFLFCSLLLISNVQLNG